MGQDSGVQWTRHTFNTWIGCEEVSPECDHCYARRGSARLGAQHGLKLWEDDRYFTSEGYWKQLPKWNRDAERAGEIATVFCQSYSDLFEDRPEFLEPRARLLRTTHETPSLQYLFLTKRPENMVRLAAPVFGEGRWPDNVSAGTTVGLLSSLPRLDEIRKVPARIRFLSMEPLLSRVLPRLDGIHWVICGGESGPKARPFAQDWASDLLSCCRMQDVPFFMKQWGSNPITRTGFTWPRGTEFHDRGMGPGWKRIVLKDGHGGDMDEWPESYRVREFPAWRPS